MNMKLKGILLSIFVILLASSASFAQCRTYAQKKCMPGLGEFKPNGSLYSNYMENGQEVELNMVLMGGQNYKIYHCHKEGLGQVWMRLFDNQGKVVFDNAEHDFVNSWEFTVKSTQEFKIKTYISQVSSGQGGTSRECAVLLLGNKIK